MLFFILVCNCIFQCNLSIVNYLFAFFKGRVCFLLHFIVIQDCIFLMLQCLNSFRSRDDLHSLFTQLLLGDVIAADYLLAHLMSKIYKRSDGLCLGKFSMNIFSLPTNSKNYAKRLSTILQLIMSKSHYFPLTIESLNSLTFVPKKDYNSNRLTSGLLQLSSGTHLVLDETVMSDGQLNSQGITNLTSLGQMIKQQSVEYDFGFHKIAFESDIPCLVFSEGRSMLPQDVQVSYPLFIYNWQ